MKKMFFVLSMGLILVLNGCSYNEVKDVPDGDDRLVRYQVIPPEFSEFVLNSGEKYSGEIAPIDFLSNPDAEKFKTELERGINEEPNFAVYYNLVTWGCGTGCQQIAVVDVRDGKVFIADFVSSVEVNFKNDSNLLIINPIENIIEAYGDDSNKWPDGLNPSYFIWESNKFEVLK